MSDGNNTRVNAYITRLLAPAFVAALIVVIGSLGGSWGTAAGQTGGYSPPQPPVVIVVTAPPGTPTPTPTPIFGFTPTTTTTTICPNPSVTIATPRLTQGQQTTYGAVGFRPGAIVQVQFEDPAGLFTVPFFSESQVGPATTTCAVASTFTLNPTVSPGRYRLSLIGPNHLGLIVTARAEFDVVSQEQPGLPTFTSTPTSTSTATPTATPTATTVSEPVPEPPVVLPTFLVLAPTDFHSLVDMNVLRTAQPGELYFVLGVEDGWALVQWDQDPPQIVGWMELGPGVGLERYKTVAINTLDGSWMELGPGVGLELYKAVDAVDTNTLDGSSMELGPGVGLQ